VAIYEWGDEDCSFGVIRVCQSSLKMITHSFILALIYRNNRFKMMTNCFPWSELS
jgi:hypothetical protein